jgi:hypothetical protein
VGIELQLSPTARFSLAREVATQFLCQHRPRSERPLHSKALRAKLRSAQIGVARGFLTTLPTVGKKISKTSAGECSPPRETVRRLASTPEALHSRLPSDRRTLLPERVVPRPTRSSTQSSVYEARSGPLDTSVLQTRLKTNPPCRHGPATPLSAKGDQKCLKASTR